MLKKLIKHEFIATARFFLPLYLFALILTPVLSLLFRFGMNSDDQTGSLSFSGIFAGIGIFGFIVMMIALFIASTILIIMRFYRTTATTEAYLTFTLPAKPGQILLSKLITSCIWQAASFVVAFVAILGILLISGIFTPDEMADAIRLFFKMLPMQDQQYFPLLSSIILSILVGIPSGILMYFCAIMIGQLFNEHRVIASFAVYIAISTALQIVSTVISIPMALILETADYSSYSTIPYIYGSMFLSAGLNVLIGIGCYLATVTIMKKKLNVR